MKLKECLEMIYVACTNYDEDITGKLGTEREYEGSYEQAYDIVLEELNNRIPRKDIEEILDYQYDLWNTPNKQKEFNLELVETLENLLDKE